MKMDMSMEVLKPLADSLKKYKALLPSIAITIAALLLLLPTMMVGDKVKEQMKQSKRMADEVRMLSGNVPSEDEPRQIRNLMDKLQDEADKIKQLAVQSSQRDLVTYDYVIFPVPEDRSSQIFTVFGDRYHRAIEKLLQKLNALDAPSDAEIRAKTGGGIVQPGAYPAPTTVTVQDPMVNALCLTRAQKISVYANPSAFPWYEFWEDYEFAGQEQAMADCWDSQVSLWVYGGIVDAITKMNGTSGNVLSLPVKRLLGVSFTGPVTAETPTFGGGVGGYYRGTADMKTRDIPNYITAVLPSNFLEKSPTARKGNEDIDVIHFAVSVLVDNRFILPFMKELCSEKPHTFYPKFRVKGKPVQSRHNQITILQTDLKVVDKTAQTHSLYRYGKGAVARLDLICEYQFNRAGYDEIKPDTVKKRLGQLDEASEDSEFDDSDGTDWE